MAFTFFFRDLQTLQTIIDYMLPSFRSRRFINIWSAGCAMGQEPYTIALLLRENMGQMIFRNVKIYASDIDTYETFGKIITEGSYPENELQRMPRDIFAKHFFPDENKPGNYQVSDEIKKRLVFQKHNLLSFEPFRNNFSLIVCKNVLLHFTEEDRSRVIRMFHGSLEEGGFFLTEHTQKMPEDVEHLFEQIVPNAHVYRKISVK
ncbi:CheR family methyltransferase [Methanogenium organophilum]|uniref:Chemotaxis protein CheR n=1 Tax=Methanogenium organophilum TaxID=2199 RepID=A0A9X9T9E5_METOG|nr:CheR family methyltransferase [Methanogenium organophilum]WAI02321.1 chemotaxis protein CheR [Methanogenium organophilum]